MKVTAAFRPQDIRNLALVGHTAVGKTALADALLARAGVVAARPPTVDAYSTSSTVHFATYAGRELNLIDTPGHPELLGQALAALPAVETAVVVVDAVAGVQLGTRRLFEAAGELGLARMIVVNRIDQNVDGLARLFDQLRAELGKTLHCMNLPTRRGADVIDCFDHDGHEGGSPDFGSVAEVHREMLESSVEIDDAEMEKYLSGETIDLAELRGCFVRAMSMGHVVPVLFASAKTGAGIEDLLHIVAEECPSPLGGRPRRLMKAGEVVEVACDVEKPFMAHVFHVMSDPQLGKIALLRILQGHLDAATTFVGHGDKKPRKAGQLLKIEGREHPELDAQAHAGDLVALARVEELHVDQVLHAPTVLEDFAPVRPRYPQPMIALAIAPLDKKDDVKLGGALALLSEEDPTLVAGQDHETKEFLLRGLGELHLRIALEKLRDRHRIQVSTAVPKVSYRETIAGRSEGHHRHKKQTGGAGQFGEVFLRVEPLDARRRLRVQERHRGRRHPQAVHHVDREGRAGRHGGRPAHRRADAGREGHRLRRQDPPGRRQGRRLPHRRQDGLPRRGEPRAPARARAHRRGRRQRARGPHRHGHGRPQEHARPRARRRHRRQHDAVHAHVPLAEIGSYAGQLRSATGGAGGFTTELAAYEPVPPLVQKRLSEAYKPTEENGE
ncbi:MAG: GTP-binding protein [Myxococcota bacterium]